MERPIVPAEAFDGRQVAQTPPPLPQAVISAPNGIAIGGGTVTNPTVVNNGPPPPKIRITVAARNQQNTTVVSVNGRPNPETLYRSTYLVDVTDSEIPSLIITAKGVTLRQLECGPSTGMYPAVTAVNGEASCSMHAVFGNDWFFSIQTLSPVEKAEDIYLGVICPTGIRCEIGWVRQ
jgi:hypothetical protein